MKKLNKILLIGGMVMAMAFGLSRCNGREERIVRYTKERLKEDYGEEFEIKHIRDGSRTIAYPVRDPDLLFECSYVMSNDNGHNEYIEAIVGKQFKTRLDEKLEGFKYDYYVDVDIAWAGILGTDTNITIEDYDRITAGTKYNPSYEFYISCDILECSDEEIYDLLKSIATERNCTLGCYIVLDEDLKLIKEEYSDYPTLSSDMYWYLDYTQHYKDLGSATINNQWNMDFEYFQEKMKEVRSNELYR